MTGARVLVVEDDDLLAPLLEDVLAEAGYQVAVARNAESLDVGELLARFDLAVIDWALPGKDGLALCRELRAHPEGSQLKVLMLTARSERADQITALANGADDFLPKPFDVEVFLARVDALLRAQAITLGEHRRARVAETLLRLTTAAERPEPLETLLVRFCREARALFAVAACYLRLGDEQATEYGEVDTSPTHAAPRLSRATLDAAVARSLAERTLLTIADESVDGDAAVALIAPLLQQGEVFGALILVDRAGPERFGPLDLEAARQFAHHAAAAIASARMAEAERARQRAERARAAVTEVALALAGQTDRQQVFEAILSQARELVGGDATALVLRETPDEPPVIAAQSGHVAPDPRNIRLGEGVAGRVLVDGQPLILDDLSQVPGVPEHALRSGLRTAVAVPLRLGAQVLGCLIVASRSAARRYDRHDVEALGLLASHGVLAIERARLLAAQEQRARQAEELRVRMETLATLAEARASQLEAVLEQMADAVIVVDRDLRMIRVNRAAEALLGSERAALMDRRSALDDLLVDPTTMRPSGERVLERAARHGSITAEREYLFRPGDTERLVSVSAAPVLQHGVVTGAVAVVRDVTTRRALEHQLTQADKLRALGELAAGVAHNFNNMLAAIMSRSELLAAEVPHPQVAEAVDYILRAAEDGAAMIRRIQAFAQRAHTGLRVAIEAEELLRDAIAVSEPRWRNAAQRRGATVSMHLDVLGTPVVFGDPGELREVLVNLINNAADALPHGGCIEVGCRPQGDRVELWVRDNGVGMPPEVQQHIFEPFFTTKGTEGTGLGLAVSYGIVASHGGTLRVESEPGRGTTMRLWLPSAPAVESEVTAMSSPAAPKNGLARRAGRLLVVDDDPKLAAMLQQILALDGYEVDVCFSGAEALAAVAARSYSLVLTDVGMPGMTGLELARELTRRLPELPVALITGWGNTIDPDEREASGARYILSKPYRIDQVRQLVQLALAEGGRSAPHG